MKVVAEPAPLHQNEALDSTQEAKHGIFETRPQTKPILPAIKYLSDTIVIEHRIVDTVLIEKTDTIYLPAIPTDSAPETDRASSPSENMIDKEKPTRVEFVFANPKEEITNKPSNLKNRAIVSPFSSRTSETRERNHGTFTVINLKGSKK